jgi:class 3 adenylate cyclase/tetratricopeptide (TPR) repeat protein
LSASFVAIGPEGQAVKCDKCQFDNPDNMRFCGQCGAKLELVCPGCGFTNPPGFKFCGGCGRDLSRPAAREPIDLSRPDSYTPKFLAEKILTRRSAIEGERKLVTVLFADVAGFTAMSERLDPEDVHQIMDGCFRVLMDEIHHYEGTVNEFRGDGVMALFGAPVAHEDHAQRACHAALAVQRDLLVYAEKLNREFGINFKMRIGLNSGSVVVGAIGDDLRMDYTAQGDTANLAARMEQSAAPGQVLVSGDTYRLAREYFEFAPPDRLTVKGKKGPVEAFRLLRPAEVETRIAASAAKGLTRFVGRKREIETLKDAFDRARSGEGQVVGIVGEAGVGKSRLLLEFRDLLPQGDYSYFEGRCLHFGGSMPYLPILDVLRSFVGIKEGERESVIRKKMRERILGLDKKLQDAIPPFQELLSLRPDDEKYAQLEPKQKREKTFEAFRNLLVRGSQERPMVLAVEDLHWIDKTSEEFLDYMIGWLPNTRILLILLYRPEYTHRWGSKSYYHKLGVDQLSSGTSAELVRAILEGGEGGDVAPELRDLILVRAAGNPFFMEELTHSLIENGSILKQEDRYVLSGKPSDIHVPDTVQGIIAARMDRLEEDLKRIMQVASVIGREFAFRILHAITEMKEDLKSNLLNLQGLEFIYEKSLFPELEYIFRHALTQEVAYNSLLVKRRKEIHEKIARAIEELYAERLEEFFEMLAYHYSRSENASQACQYLKLSGDKARRNFSLWETFRYYGEAVNLLRDQPETQHNRQVRLEIIQAMAHPMRMLGHPEGSLEFFEEGEGLALELGDRKALAHCQTNIGMYYLTSAGDPVKGRDYIERGLGETELTEEVEIIVPATSDLIASHIVEGNYSRACLISPKLIDLIEKTHTEYEMFGRPSNIYSILHGYYGSCLGAVGRFAEGERILDKGLSFALDINNVISIAQNELYLGILFWFKGDNEKVAEHCRPAIESLEKGQVRIFLGIAWAYLGWGYFFTGQTDQALRCAEKGLELHTDRGIQLFLGSIHNTLSEIHLNLGSLEKALVHAEHAAEMSRKNNENHWVAETMITLGRVIAATDRMRFEQARDLILEGISRLDELQIRPRFAVGLMRLGELFAAAGQRDQAIEKLNQALKMFEEMGMGYWPGKTRELLASIE